MLTFFLIAIAVGITFGFFAFIVKGFSNSVGSEMIDCPKCGKKIRLFKSGTDCPKCLSRVYKDNEGNVNFNA